MLRGSEKDADGGDRKGGGNGRGGRFANRAIPVSNRNGSMGIEQAFGGEDGEEAEANLLSRQGCHARRWTGSGRRKDVGMDARSEDDGLRIPAMNTGAVREVAGRNLWWVHFFALKEMTKETK